MPPSTTPTKATLRDRFRAYRRGLSESEWTQRSAAIRDRVRPIPELREASTVHVYWPHADQREVDTRPLIDDLHTNGVTVALPAVTSYPPDPPSMEHRCYTGRDDLTPNRWGIPEPTTNQSVSGDAIDAVLVPALGAGRNGHRIGHGAGYYDVFLASVDAPSITLVYDETLVPSVPAEPHDQPVDIIVTETMLLRP